MGLNPIAVTTLLLLSRCRTSVCQGVTHTCVCACTHTHTHTHTHLFSWKSTFLSLFKACKAILPPALPESCWGVLIYGINICRNTWLHHEGAKAERENKSIQSKIENITQKTKILLSQQYPMMIKDKLNLKVPIQQWHSSRAEIRRTGQ